LDSLTAMTQVEDWREILVLAAALETGVLDRAAAGGTAEALAADLGLDARAVRVTLVALADRGWVHDDDGVVTLTPKARAALGPEPEDPVLAEVRLAAREMAAYGQLDRTLRTGQPSHDVSAGDTATRRRFLEAMRAIASRRAPATVSALGPPAGSRRLLDVGGGPGTYARAFAAAGWEVTVVDLPESLALGGDELAGWGIARIAADVTHGVPDGPWDAVYLGNVVHLFGPPVAADLVRAAGQVLRPAGRLAIQEVILGRSGPAALFGITMLTGTESGEAYDEATYAGWMAAAGCPLEGVVDLDHGRHHLLLGTRR